MSDSVCKKVADIILNKYLDCPVCLEFAVCPIYGCKNGHIVCGICQEGISQCPTCRDNNMTEISTYERILKSEGVKLACRNGQHGCTQEIKPHEMKEHLTSFCDFRQINCTEICIDCKGESYNPKDLYKHWLEVEKMSKMEVIPATDSNAEYVGTALRSLELREEVYTDTIGKKSGTLIWPTRYFEFEDRNFFCHTRSIDTVNFHTWITMLGHEVDANKFKYSAILSSNCSSSKKTQIIIHEIPVHCLQYYDINKVEVLGHTVAVSFNTMKLLHDKKPTDPQFIFEWDIKFEITKCEEPLSPELEPKSNSQ